MDAGRRTILTLAAALISSMASADGPADNVAEKVRPIPPPGVAVPPDVKTSLEAKLNELTDAVAALDGLKSKKPNHALLVPDVEIYAKAVHYALAYGEFFDTKEFTTAERLLDEGLKRAKSLAAGDAPWTRAVGLV
ncbi:MAG: hypothetical protein ACRDD1_16265, partial [Planctomycetia bacterium]